MGKESELVLWFDQINVKDVSLVGGKNASLGEMYQNLTKKGINIPNGFAVTATAYRYFMKENKLIEKIKEILNDLDTRDVNNLRERGRKVRDAILHADFPSKLKNAIEDAYLKLSQEYGQEYVDVAVRSSATAEDLPDASFAGQQETYLNIRGVSALLDAVKKCFASLFTDRAISYREDKGFDHFSIALSVGVQKMVRSDKGASGVMFTLDTESGFRDVILINAAYGLGENVVQGVVNPDQYYVFKPTLLKGYKAIISKRLGSKEKKMVYTEDSLHPTKNVETTEKERNSFALSDEEILTLAKWGIEIESHYSKKYGKDMPMDIEWAKDGIENKLYIVQARPETVHSVKDKSKIVNYKLKGIGKILVKGLAVGDKISQGKVHVIENVSKIHEFKEGEILVTEITDPDWEPIMKIASAIITNKGGRTSHAAIVARELGIPAIVGTGNATEVLKNGQEITVDCSSGYEGYVYDGLIDYVKEEIDVNVIPKTRTKIMMNVANPEQAFKLSFLPNDGVGLAREEFIINSHIRIHPNALLYYDELKKSSEHKGLITRIDEITKGYTDKVQFYIDKLAEGIALIAAAFYPKDVIVRFSDFKSNEYRNLIGGYLYEPSEENPMMGWRGASRYYSDNFKEAFALELLAIKKVREEMGLDNVIVMIPFCRTIKEAEKVLEIMKEYGMERGNNGLKVYMMVEIPSNVILIDKFSKYFDGFSIGSNDLTQLTLGVDRDSSLVSHVYDERDEAVKEMLSLAIKGAKRNGRKIGICGQAPSDFPEIAEFLVKEGIDSISLNPDTVVRTRFKIKDVEDMLDKSKKEEQ